MREFGVHPDRDLGQNFLIDSNILGVIDRAAELAPRTSCSRSAAASACSRSTWPSGSRHVHVVEIDERLRPALDDATRGSRQHERALGRRDEHRPAGAGPPRRSSSRTSPTGSPRGCCCARSRSCRRVERWVAMVQREVGERLAAAPGSGAYGTPSVLAQLACEVEVLRAIPAPSSTRCRTSTRCSSRMARARDGGRPPRRRCAALVGGALRPPAQDARRLARALGRRTGPLARARSVRGAAALGHPADVRAERLSPEHFRALARVLEL